MAIKTHYYKVRNQNLSPIKDLKPLLVIAKKSRKYPWLQDADSIALQQSIINLDKAFKNFFNPEKDAGFPRFKSRQGKQSSYHCTSVSTGDNWIKIPKCKPIKARVHREIKGIVKSITVNRSPTGKYYASILVDCGQEAPKPIADLEESKIVGVDMGITDLASNYLLKPYRCLIPKGYREMYFSSIWLQPLVIGKTVWDQQIVTLAITSEGYKTGNPRFIRNAQRNLKRKQQALCRRKKGSKGRAKARLIVAKAYERAAFARNDFQHKLSKQLIDENQAVIVETLKIKNMLKNHCLARAIADAGWDSLIKKLEYKAKQVGKYLIKIDPWFPSSKTCCVCKVKQESMPLSIRLWTCSCGAIHDRDICPSINIKDQGILMLKAEGLSVSADGGERKSSILPVAA